jgi:hypothetical protein
MQELKPEGWMHAYYPPNNPQKYWTYRNTPSRMESGTGEVKALYAIPDTHRIVSVELLERVMVFPGSEDEALLRAIIEKEQT